MNKTLLLIICDFLLLSLIGFIEIRELNIDESTSKENYNKKARDNLRQAEIIDLLENSLQFEQAGREKLAKSLEKTKTTLEEERERRESTEKSSAEEKNILLQDLSEAQKELIGTEQKRSLLVEEVTLLGQQASAYKEKLRLLKEELEANASIRAEYKQELAKIEKKSADREEQLQELKLDLAVKQTENSSLKTELKDQKENLNLYEEKINRLEKEQLKIFQDKQTLFAELKVLEVEKQKTEKMLNYVQAEVDTNRIEKQILEEMVDTTKVLKKEIDKRIVLSPHAIFQRFQDNKAVIQFITGDNKTNLKRKSPPQSAVLVSSTQGLFALVHTRNTPLALTGFGNRWPDNLSAFIKIGDDIITPEKVSFLKIDPRVMAIRIDSRYQQKLAEKAFSLTQTPFSFTKAVLISNDETGNYGETQFKIDLAGKNYLKMLRKPFSRLFGIFTPDKSDFIFSQSGNLIGIMVNRNYCIAIRDFTIVESLNINPYSKQKAEETKTMLSKSIKQLPTTFR